MTQQEKVAAALMRAGIASPANWANSASATEDGPLGSTSTAVADPPSSSAQTYVVPLPLTPQERFSVARRLLLMAGSLLALISLYIFLRLQ